MEDTTYVADRFWLNPDRRLYGFYGASITAGRIDVCRSECIQNGKRCPLYNTCTDRFRLREILP